MTADRLSRIGLRLATGAGPRRSSTCRSRSSSSTRSTRDGTSAWPPSGFTLHWFGEALHNTGLQQAFLTSLVVRARRDADRAAPRHAWPRSPWPATTGSDARPSRSSSCCRSPCRASSPGMALSATFASLGIRLGLLTVIIGHATFCVVLVFNNAIARLRRTVGLVRGGVRRPRRRRLPDVPVRDVPGAAVGAPRRRPAGVRPVVRRGDRHDLHGRRASRRCRSGSSRASASRTRSRSSTSPAWSRSCCP